MISLQEWCLDCWKEKRGRRSPHQVSKPEMSTCYLCGKKNEDGIYVRVDSLELEHVVEERPSHD